MASIKVTTDYQVQDQEKLANKAPSFALKHAFLCNPFLNTGSCKMCEFLGQVLRCQSMTLIFMTLSD